MSMMTTSQHTTLSIGQLHILEMMNRCRTKRSLNQLKKLLFDFYSKEAVAEAERLLRLLGLSSRRFMLSRICRSDRAETGKKNRDIYFFEEEFAEKYNNASLFL